MPRVQKINHKGIEILFIDYKGCRTEQEMIELIKEAAALVTKENKEYLQLTDLTGAFVTPGYLRVAKQVAKVTPKLAKKRAIVGVDSTSRRFLLKMYSLVIGSENAIKPFSDIEEAKDWLVA